MTLNPKKQVSQISDKMVVIFVKYFNGLSLGLINMIM